VTFSKWNSAWQHWRRRFWPRLRKTNFDDEGYLIPLIARRKRLASLEQHVAHDPALLQAEILRKPWLFDYQTQLIEIISK